ncbi:MAG: hypothetical protein KJ922_04420, partial [Nanoarchaeota archaeon]|nr:hypothetical protein [Nanoarchaeota archaeon]
MRQIFFIFIIITLMSACTPVADINEDIKDDTNEDLECTQDSDCKREGCSGTLCYPVNAPEIATICNWEPEYACYKD